MNKISMIQRKEAVVSAARSSLKQKDDLDLKYFISRLKLDTGLKQKLVESILTDLENVREVSIDWVEGSLKRGENFKLEE